MKKKVVKKSSIRQPIMQHKCRSYLWIIVAFFCGFVIGYSTYYTVINWHGFFVNCPNGEKPDKNGCCDGEIYTDAGDGWMVCCPDGGDNCFPPLK